MGASGLSLVPKEMEAEPCLVLTGLKAQGMYGAYLVRDADMESLRRAEEHFVDRKTKNERKELSRVLLEQRKIPLVVGCYKTSGRLMQGVEALLKKAEEKSDRNLYVIGTDEELFNQLWQSAASRAKSGPATLLVKKAESDAGKLANNDAAAANRLLEMLPAGEVPEELVRSYVGQSAEAQLVRRLIMVAATRTEEPVLILGDTGTGKEVVARAIHNQSARRVHQFVPVNCAAIPHELLEVELFGSAGGVATGVTARAGLWELTGKGTLFLDEIGDLSPSHQVKILRALQEKKIRRLGERREREVGARIIAATNRNLFSLVQTGRFREDLYYRLHYLRIPTPALHKHPQDIALLAPLLWKEITGDPASRLPAEILRRLESYRWPGNVRELKAVLSNLYALFGKNSLNVKHLDAVYQPPQVSPDAELFQRGDEERLKGIAHNYETYDLKQEKRLIGVWKGTGEDLIIPGHVELEKKHTYKLTLDLKRVEGRISGTMRAYVPERKSANTARIELISISENYFTFQYLLTDPNSSHYGVMMMHLLGIGNQMKGFFLTKKVFESKIGIGALCFNKE
ncbi:MAG TPA: sigma 54-interacting transcriptional regulator [Blastocatellia bacterium]|nr:sigma 54-interacting transcriptional regulator [Blastocatellia bacterium]